MLPVIILLATHSLAGWRGETINFKSDSRLAIEAAPQGVTVREGVLKNVSYVTKPHGTEYAAAADRVAWDAAAPLVPGQNESFGVSLTVKD